MPRPRSQGIVAALLLGTVALIVYGSLYPFDLSATATSKSFGQAISELSWARAGRGDRVANVLLYAPLGFCLMLWLYGRMARRVAVVATVVLGFVLSFSVEIAQVYIDQRVPSWWDIVLNCAGTILGAVAGMTWHELGGRMRTSASQSGRPDRAATVVLIFWIAWRLAPFDPEFSLRKLKATFAPLADPYFSTMATVHYWVWWTLMAYVVFAIARAQRGTETLLALIAVVLASCLVISNHTFVPSELLALMLLMPTLFLFDRLTPEPRLALLLVGVVGLVVYDALLPFQFSTSPSSFNLWPFLAWIDTGFHIDFEWLTQRAFYFASLTWILKECGASHRALAIVPIAALALEVVQLWIPGQRASISDPAVALTVTSLFRFLDSDRAIRQRAHNR